MELPKLDAPPSFGCPHAGAARGIRISCGSRLRKGLPFARRHFAPKHARVEKKWHYCFWTKDPNPRRLSPAGKDLEGGANPISLSLSVLYFYLYLYLYL
jgi:hypothetical protein